jgi:sulfite reductase alpha subunit-like flavoprotein
MFASIWYTLLCCWQEFCDPLIYSLSPLNRGLTGCAWPAAGSLSKVTFSVFGVGNSQWAQTYQAFPTQVALQLARAGATQVRA